MDDVKSKLQAALKEAMMAKDNFRRDVVRLLQSAIKQVEIDTRKELSNEEMIAILQKEAKKRRESIEEAQRGGRGDIVENELAEVRLIETFLPAPLSREEVVALAQEAIAASGATSVKEMGKVMGVLMPKVKGLADGGLVNQVVKELLNA
ncbi:MAG: GatB/YqeY domain-containing protein [Chloroflexi bacterium]|nr:GatB/YqeY domain-containing protein [Chloroflexota bacterium]